MSLYQDAFILRVALYCAVTAVIRYIKCTHISSDPYQCTHIPIKVPVSLMGHTNVAISLCNIVVCARSGETVAEPPCDTRL